MSERNYTTRRLAIVEALTQELKNIDGTGEYVSNLYDNVHPRLKFWDEVTQFPAIHLNPGAETREYQAGGYKDRFLGVTVRCYVHEEDAASALEALLEDVETVVEKHSRLQYTDRLNNYQYTQQITIASITTDEGTLEPYGVGEIQLEVRY
jgi:hypothetical protein